MKLKILKEIIGEPLADEALLGIRERSGKKFGLYLPKKCFSLAKLRSVLLNNRDFFPFFIKATIHRTILVIHVYARADVAPWLKDGLASVFHKLKQTLRDGLNMKVASIELLNPLDVSGLLEFVRTATYTSKLFFLAKNKVEILRRDDFRCKRCGNPDELTIDHIVDMHSLGYHDREDPFFYHPDACQVLCTHCHLLKNLEETWFLRVKVMVNTFLFWLKHSKDAK